MSESRMAKSVKLLIIPTFCCIGFFDKYSQDSFIARREGHLSPQLSVSLVFRASSGLVVAPTTVLHIRERWGLGELSGLAIDETCNKRLLTVTEIYV